MSKLSAKEYERLVHDAVCSAIKNNMFIADMDTLDFELLLCEDRNIDTYILDRQRGSCLGYPTAPFYKEIAKVFHEWSETSICPIRILPIFECFDDKEYRNEFRVTEREVFELLKGMESLWDHWNYQERIYRIHLIMRILRRRGLLTLLGIRKTFGSVDHWPPQLSSLIGAFDKPIPNCDMLSEGARAVSKHYCRDNTLQFWGQCKGNDREKTKFAHSKLLELVKIAVWINMHYLPGKVPIIEIRQENGYGARWSVDGLTFRGLLEPHMVDGHIYGWKH